MTAASLFRLLDATAVQATDRARGPWDPDALHGGPTAALLARAVEQHNAAERASGDDGGVDWFVSRLTVELERPVPTTPLTWRSVTTRPGRKVSLVDVELVSLDAGRVVARARALRIRDAHVHLPVDDPDHAPHLALAGAPPGPHTVEAEPSTGHDYEGFHNAGTEHRFIEGGWQELGATIDWVRLVQPVVAGEEPTPLQRVAAAVDFPNGIASGLSMDTHTYINPDLTLHVFRPALGEWVGLAARCHYGEHGIGLSDTAVYDTQGRVGRSNQSILLDHRPT